MAVDKHKVWLMAGVVIVLLVVGFILVYPSLTNKTVAGQASALAPNPSTTGKLSPNVQLPSSCLNLQKLNVKDKPNVDSARARRGIICNSAKGCTYNKGSTPESDQCVGTPSTCPASIQSWSYSSAADNTARKETCESLTALKCNFQEGDSVNVNDYKDSCVPHTEGSSTPQKKETELPPSTTTPESKTETEVSHPTTTSGSSFGEICTNAKDDDKDGMADCKDSDCAADANCPTETGDACTSATLPLKRINNVYHKCAQWGKVGLVWLVNLNGPCSVDSQCIPNTACEGSKCLGKEGITCSSGGKPNNAFCAKGYTCDAATNKCVKATATKTVHTTDTTTTTTGTTTTTSIVCGNGIKEAGEECDDGNSVIDDGCSSCKKACNDPDHTSSLGELDKTSYLVKTTLTSATLSGAAGAKTDYCSGEDIYEYYCGVQPNEMYDFGIKEGYLKCASLFPGSTCVDGACVISATEVTVTEVSTTPITQIPMTESNCGDSVTNDDDNLVDCEDVIDCAEGASCGLGKKCNNALCVFDMEEGNYNGKGKIDKEDIQAIKSNPAGFWNYAGKNVQKLNQYLKKIADGWKK